MLRSGSADQVHAGDYRRPHPDAKERRSPTRNLNNAPCRAGPRRGILTVLRLLVLVFPGRNDAQGDDHGQPAADCARGATRALRGAAAAEPVRPRQSPPLPPLPAAAAPSTHVDDVSGSDCPFAEWVWLLWCVRAAGVRPLMPMMQQGYGHMQPGYAQMGESSMPSSCSSCGRRCPSFYCCSVLPSSKPH